MVFDPSSIMAFSPRGQPMRVVVFTSEEEEHVDDLVAEQKKYGSKIFKVLAVFSERVIPLEDIPTHVEDFKAFSEHENKIKPCSQEDLRERYFSKIIKKLDPLRNTIDLIAFLSFKIRPTKQFVDLYRGRIFGIHPSLFTQCLGKGLYQWEAEDEAFKASVLDPKTKSTTPCMYLLESVETCRVLLFGRERKVSAEADLKKQRIEQIKYHESPLILEFIVDAAQGLSFNALKPRNIR